MNYRFLLLSILASITLAAMEDSQQQLSPGFSNGRCNKFLSLKALAARQVLKTYEYLEDIDFLKVSLSAESITLLRLEWIKLRWLDKTFYKGYHEGKAFHEAAYFGLADTIPFLYEEGGCLFHDWPNESNQTPLFRAVSQGHLETTRALLNLRIHPNPDKHDNLDHTPLYYAARAKNKEMVQLLLDHGAQVHLMHDIASIRTPFQAIEKTLPENCYHDDKDRKEIIAILKKAELEQRK